METNTTRIEEGFVFDYTNKRWFGYSLADGENTERPSFSALLNMDMDRMLIKRFDQELRNS
ncbi:MAG: hypothetical protein HC880_09240 [Bacteroidia bacterium]|nr:hypothetical protein [Bacteroidia bacterium]